jgi:hypothetical protein
LDLGKSPKKLLAACFWNRAKDMLMVDQFKSYSLTLEVLSSGCVHRSLILTLVHLNSGNEQSILYLYPERESRLQSELLFNF